jgi:hypothetical protein
MPRKSGTGNKFWPHPSGEKKQRAKPAAFRTLGGVIVGKPIKMRLMCCLETGLHRYCQLKWREPAVCTEVPNGRRGTPPVLFVIIPLQDGEEPGRESRLLFFGVSFIAAVEDGRIGRRGRRTLPVRRFLSCNSKAPGTAWPRVPLLRCWSTPYPSSRSADRTF